MEFIASKYLFGKSAEGGVFPSFEILKHSDCIQLDSELQVIDSDSNRQLLSYYKENNWDIIPIKRKGRECNNKDFPKRILMEMTSVCNTKCLMCPQMNLKRPLVHLPVEKYKELLDEISRQGVSGLWIYHFGESLLHPHFSELINYIKTKSNLGDIWLSTNGILLDEEKQNLLLGSSLSYLNFSLQSISSDNYKKIAPLSPSSTILKNLHSLIEKKKRFLRKKPYFRLQIVEQKYTLNEIDPFLRQYHDKCDIISVNMLEHTDITFNVENKFLREHSERVYCKRIQRGDCFINSDGSVAICDNAYNNQMDIGNVFKNDIFTIWNGTLRQKIIQENQQGRLWEKQLCRECTDYDL